MWTSVGGDSGGIGNLKETDPAKATAGDWLGLLSPPMCRVWVRVRVRGSVRDRARFRVPVRIRVRVRVRVGVRVRVRDRVRL